MTGEEGSSYKVVLAMAASTVRKERERLLSVSMQSQQRCSPECPISLEGGGGGRRLF